MTGSLPYAEIPPERLPILDYTSRLGDDGLAGVLGVALAEWSARSDDRPDSHARRAASRAMDAIDSMIAGLFQLRAQLLGEIRASDDQAAVRADELLARIRSTEGASS